MNKHYLRGIVQEALNSILIKEEETDGQFSVKNIPLLPSFRQRINYCIQYLGKPIGNGSSRTVFRLDDRWVLKVAKNNKGLAQNEYEGGYDTYRDSFGIFPEKNRELSDMENYTYIITEYAKPLRVQDVKTSLGISWHDFQKFINTSGYHRDYDGRRGGYWGERFNNDDYNALLDYDDERTGQLSKFQNYIYNTNVCYQDIMRKANLGTITRDGQLCIVILDDGITDDIYNQYYR